MRTGFMFSAAALCAAPAAGAQDVDPVTLYGRVYALVESVEVVGGTAAAFRRARVTDQASRIGVRGTEALGNGLSAWFQLETGFAIESNAGSFATRASAVGLLGHWGTILLGRWDSAFTASQTMVDPFGHLGLADIAGAALNQGNFTRRERNVVQYWSPRVGGWRTKVNYTANEGKSATMNPYDYAANVSFENSSVYAAVAFEKHNDQVGGTPTAGSDEDGVGVSAMGRLGTARISAQYGRYRRTGTVAQKSFMVGFDATRGVHQVLGTYQRSRDGGTASLSLQPRCRLIGAGYRYRVSASTFMMVQYAAVDNRVGALCNFGTSPVAIAEGQGLRGFGAGMRIVY